jgi:hypothetical protein
MRSKESGRGIAPGARGGEQPRGWVRRVGLSVVGAIALLVLTGAAHAQQVYWDDPGPVAAGQQTSLDLVFADTDPAGRVAVPRVDGLTVLGPPSQQSSISIINGKRNLTLTLSFPVRADRAGDITIPSFDVATSDGPQTVASLALEVGAATSPRDTRGAGAKDENVIEARLTPSTMTPYAGEVFHVDATIALTGGRNGQVIGVPTWEKSGLSTEPWGEGKQVTTQTGSGVRFRSRAIATQSGRIAVAPVQQEVEVEGGRERVDPFAGFDDAFGRAFRKFGGSDIFDSFFSRPQMTRTTVRSNAAQLDVRPLPQPAPAGFSGVVGQFELESSTVPAQPKTGEPVTWTLTLKGTGNWPGGVTLPARAVPNDLRTLQPKQHKDFADGELFSGTLSEDLVLVPEQPGDFALEPVSFVYFDPAAGKYRSIETRPSTLHITGAPIAAQPKSAPVAAHAPGAPATAGGAPAIRNAGGVPADGTSTGAALPHDPLHGSATAFPPIAMRQLMTLAGVPVVLLLIYWLALAVQHARRNDPRRPQREAFRQLAVAIERVRAAATDEERIAALLAWQHTAAVALNIDLAAPTATQIADQQWSDVWAGSERGLYGREHAVPAGWCEHALALCERTRRPRFNPLRALTARHLIPKAAAAAVLIAVAATPGHAADAVDAYAKGDFAAAHEALITRVKTAPTDWIARYNLGLAEAQRGDAGHALGETLAAFVHAPRQPDVWWNARAFAARVPGFDRAAAALVAAPHLATVASPAEWQGLALAAVLLGCAGCALTLRRRYRDAHGRAWAGLSLIVIAAAIGGGAVTSLNAYGRLADPRVAMVAGQPVLRSVPTDAEPAQQQKPLPAGTLVMVEQDFLGWVKVDRDGETGWLRHGDLVPLYAEPSA